MQAAPSPDARVESLRETLRRAVGAEYWAEHLGVDVAERVHSLDDLTKLPTTSPDALKSRAHDQFLAIPLADVYHYHQSFGTTGRPSCGWYTVADIEAEVPMIRRAIHDLGPGSVLLNRYPYSFPVPNLLIETAARLKGGCVVPAGALNFNVSFVRALDLLRQRKVTHVASLPWEPIFLAETARLCGLDPSKDFPDLKTWLVAGSLVPPRMKALIEAEWNCDLRVLYGSTEAGPMASSCAHGRMHLHDDDFIFEVVNDSLVLTTLRRVAQPMVRYDTGDAVRLTGERCPCGDDHRVVELQGRRDGMLAWGDRRISDLELHDAVLEHGAPWKSPVFYCVMTKRGLLVRIETREPRDAGRAEAQAALTAALGLPVRLRLVRPGTLINHVALLSGWHVFKPSIVSDWRIRGGRRVINWSGALVDWWGQLDVGLLAKAARKWVEDKLLALRLRLFG